MGVFDLFKNNNPSTISSLNGNGQQSEINPEIKEEVFIHKGKEGVIDILNAGISKHLNDVYDFLKSDFDEKGYRDALVNPESSHLRDNIELIKRDLYILIKQATTTYEDRNREIESHMESRSRAGLIDVVEDLKCLLQTNQSHLQKLENIKTDTDSESGDFIRLKLSYQKGFNRGFVALTHHKFLMNIKTDY